MEMKILTDRFRLVRTTIFCVVILQLVAARSLACFSIVVGKDASVNGGVIMAHNEDDSPPQLVHHRNVPRRHHAPGDKVQLRNGGQLDQVEWTWGYMWSEMPGMLFSDGYVNEWGVCVSSDNCPSREDRTELTDGGIGYMLRRLVAERAKSARQGVLLAGSLVERFGYIDSGRTYFISDPDEGWLFCVVRGKHWLAKRVADDEVAVVANTYAVHQVDLSDKDNVLAARDIVTYAADRGWYDPDSDGPFDFAAAYANPTVAKSTSNLGRQWQGLRYLVSEPISYGPDMPSFVVPHSKVGVSDIFKILRHARDAEPEQSAGPVVCPPQGSCLICRDMTQTSFVVELRRGQPLDIGIVYWVSLAPPGTSFFIPFHFGSTFPAGFAGDAGRPFKALYDQKVSSPFHPDQSQAFWTFSNFRDKALQMSDQGRARILAEANAIEQTALRLRGPLEETARRLYRKDKTGARELLTNFSRGLYMSSMEAMDRIMKQQISDKVKAIHAKAITLDSHVDIAKGVYATAELDPGVDNPKLKCDLVKMDKGGVDGVFLAVFVDQTSKLNAEGYAEAQKVAEDKFAAIKRLTETMYPDRCGLARSPDDVERILASGRKAIAIGIENGFPIGEDLDRLDYYHGLGARYVTLCHMRHNQICDSSDPETPMHNGLSEFGKQVVRRMNKLGMMCDSSHASEKTFFDLLEVSEAPILVSHSGCSAIYDHDRNLTDQQLRALKENGGVIQIVGLGAYLKAETPERKEAMRKLRQEYGIPSRQQRRRMSDAEYEAIRPKLEAYGKHYSELAEMYPVATVEDFVDHINHAVKIAGIDHVGIGTDFDGGGGIRGFNTHAEAMNVTRELLERGYSDEDICKIWGANLLRLWREVQALAE